MEEKTISIIIKTPARLHFGMIDLRGDLGRKFGSLGVAIDRPNVILHAESLPTPDVTGEGNDRAIMFAERLLSHLGIRKGVHLNVVADIPPHIGLGSGTQLAFAVGTALSKLFDLKLSINELALILDRSKRSAIGMYGFAQGGFIVECKPRLSRRYMRWRSCRCLPGS